VGDEPPNEIRVFTEGWNDTTKGRFLFDGEAAQSVIAAYQEHGTDVMFDLEHLSLESPQESRNFDPDARAWAKLEVRGGELWAVGIRWTPDGDRRLRERTQRYISPAFDVDPQTKRIVSLVNVALTSLPATHGLQPLVAATERMQMDPKEIDIATVAEALGVDMPALVKALGLGADASPMDVAAAATAFADKIGVLVGMKPAEAEVEEEAPKSEPMPEAGPEAMKDGEDDAKAEMVAARQSLLRETGARSMLEALSAVASWKSSHIKLEAERAKLAQERAALEAAERRVLVGELVKLGFETPATAWSDASATKPAEPWASMGLDALKSRVGKLRASKGAGVAVSQRLDTPRVSESGSQTFNVNGQVVELSARELDNCRKVGAKPEDYARNKAIQLAARGR
jgi:phage I-like protein